MRVGSSVLALPDGDKDSVLTPFNTDSRSMVCSDTADGGVKGRQEQGHLHDGKERTVS